MSKKIKSTQGKFIIVDDDLFEELNQYNWCANRKGKTYYAERRGSGVIVYIHRQILNLKSGDGKIVDHINHNGLDNRRSIGTAPYTSILALLRGIINVYK